MDRIGKNIFFNLMGFAWPLVLGFVVTPVVRNHLGDDLYGIWALTLNLTGYFYLLNAFQGAGTKYLAEFHAVDDMERVEKLTNTTLVYYVVIGVAGAAACFFASHFIVSDIFKILPAHFEQAVLAFRLTSLGILFMVLTWWGSGIIAGLMRYDWLAWILIIQTTISSLGSIVAALMGWGVIGVVIANVAGLGMNSLTCFWVIRRLLPEIRLRLAFDGTVFRRVIGYSLITTLIMLLGLVMTQLDQTLLGAWISTSAVTLYNIPLNLARKIQFACNKTAEVIFPETSRLNSIGDQTALRSLFLKSLKLNLVSILLLSVPLFLFAPEILYYWIAPDFSEKAALIMRLLVLTYAMLSLTAVPSLFVNGLGFPQFNLVLALIPGTLSLLGYIVLIPRLGVLGACWANLIANAVTTVIFVPVMNFRFLKVPGKMILRTSILKPVLVGVITSVVFYFVKGLHGGLWIFLVELGMTFCVFILLTMLLKVWEADEIAMVKRLLLKMVGRVQRGI
jgi:O-antigen/teichoic acid export membrane protein